MADPFTVQKLSNGLRVVIESMPDVSSAAAGFLVDTGARDETPEQAGVSHFLEHMMFKGTTKRSWRQITVDFDSMGSSYNAYTSEDRTMYYGWVRRHDIDRQIELLADMLRSTLPPEEFQTEKKVILEEIAMAKDSLDHVAFDFVQEKVYDGHPLAWPILGYDSTVGDMQRDVMYEYFQQRYVPENIILVVAGHVDPADVIQSAERYCGDWQPGTKSASRKPPVFRHGSHKLQVDQFNQQVIALTFPAVSASSELAETASAAATILGGDNSRFYWNIAQAGIAPRAGAYHFDFSDCGLMLLYGATQPEQAERLYETMREEARKIGTEPVDAEELARVKNKRRTGLALEAEVPYQRLSQLMDDCQYRGRPRTVDEMLSEVDAITVDGILEYMQEYPIHEGGHFASVGPRDWPEPN